MVIFEHQDTKYFQYIFLLIATGLFVIPAQADSQDIISFRDCMECPEMVEIPKGSFFMGSDNSRSEEKPIHEVAIEYYFAVGKYEITRRQYAIFFKNSNYPQKPGCEVYDLPSFNMDLNKSWVDPAFKQGDDHPVVCVNWHDAQAYVNWLSKQTGERYRLLSESEWEYVARAGSITNYGFGDNIDSVKANYADEFRGTTTVGSYPANAFGLHDIHGNAAEWVADCWTNNYEQTPVTGGSMTGDPCNKRIFRGGTWHNAAQYLRSAFRYGYFAEFKLSGLGFRVAKQL